MSGDTEGLKIDSGWDCWEFKRYRRQLLMMEIYEDTGELKRLLSFQHPEQMTLPNKPLIATQPHPDSLSDFNIPEPQPLPGQRYRLGDMLWAKVGSHPYWPCMVFYGPESNCVCRPHSKAGTRHAYHVQFFGPLVERAWVPDNANLLPYEGKAAFDEYVQEQGWRTKAARAQFEVRPRIQPVWEASWREAEEAHKLPHRERMFRYGRVYYDDSSTTTAPTTSSGGASPPADKKKDDVKKAKSSVGGKEDSDSDWSETAHRRELMQQQPRQRVATSSRKKRSWSTTGRQKPQPAEQLTAKNGAKVSAKDSDVSGDSGAETDAEAKSDDDGSPVQFQFQRLKPPPPLGSPSPTIPPAPVCGRCEEPDAGDAAGVLVACGGVCARLYHSACLLRRQPKPLCDNCCRLDRPGGCCGLCDEPADPGRPGREVCQTCARVFHAACLDRLIEAAKSVGLGAAASLRLLVRREGAGADAEGGLIACPRHACRSCVIDGCPVGQAAVGVQVSCVRCPTAYHASQRCVPAGSRFLTATSIVCPDHLVPESSKRRSNCSATATRHVNAAWCFACLRSCGLVGCQRCPAAYHPACLPASDQACLSPASFICARCRLSWHPRCGDLVWVKVGPFRWWPCEVLLSDHAPPNIQRLGKQLGTFPVRFFGTDEYYWVSLARLFPFRDGDLGESPAAAAGSAGTETPDLMDKFNEGVALAQEAWVLRDRDRQDARRLLGELAAPAPSGPTPPAASDAPESSSTATPSSSAAEPQQPPAQPVEAAVSSLMARCDCQRRDLRCGELDGCANRLAGIECHPAACGPGCLNQRLGGVRPAQPELALFKRPRLDRGLSAGDPRDTASSKSGWAVGLSSSSGSGSRFSAGQPLLVDLPGDLLDPSEARRRLGLLRRLRHRRSQPPPPAPLMLQLDWRRVLDVGGLATRLAGSADPRGPRRANARFERWSTGAGGGELRAGLFAVGAVVSAGEELVVDWDGAACCAPGFGEDGETATATEDDFSMEQCPDFWTSPLCQACEQPISACQRHQTHPASRAGRRSQQSQLFHIRCLDCNGRYHAECARLLACADSLSDPAVANFYCDSCLRA